MFAKNVDRWAIREYSSACGILKARQATSSCAVISVHAGSRAVGLWSASCAVHKNDGHSSPKMIAQLGTPEICGRFSIHVTGGCFFSTINLQHAVALGYMPMSVDCMNSISFLPLPLPHPPIH